jgi:hypothetical protein
MVSDTAQSSRGRASLPSLLSLLLPRQELLGNHSQNQAAVGQEGRMAMVGVVTVVLVLRGCSLGMGIEAGYERWQLGMNMFESGATGAVFFA